MSDVNEWSNAELAESVAETLSGFSIAAKDAESVRVLTDAAAFLEWTDQFGENATLVLSVTGDAFDSLFARRSAIEASLTKLLLAEIRLPHLRINDVRIVRGLEKSDGSWRGAEAGGVASKNASPIGSEFDSSDSQIAESVAHALWLLSKDDVDARLVLSKGTPILEWDHYGNSARLGVLLPAELFFSLSDTRHKIQERLARLLMENVRTRKCELDGVALFLQVEKNQFWRLRKSAEDNRIAQDQWSDSDLADAFSWALWGSANEVSNDELAQVLTEASPTIEENERYGEFVLNLHLPRGLYNQIAHRRDIIQKTLSSWADDVRAARGRIQSVHVYPRVEKSDGQWRAEAALILVGLEISNQGRVRSDSIATRQHQGLLFRSHTETVVFRELRARGDLLIAPLPAFLIPGEPRREPDFFVLYHGKVAIIEVHGPRSDASDERLQAFIDQGIRVKHLPVRVCDDAAQLRNELDEFFAEF